MVAANDQGVVKLKSLLLDHYIMTQSPFFLNISNTTSVISRPLTAYPFTAPEFIRGFSGVRVAQIFGFLYSVLSYCSFTFDHCIVFSAI